MSAPHSAGITDNTMMPMSKKKSFREAEKLQQK